MDIAGSVMVVTGASSGIGEATAREAHRRGARVVLAARREDRLQRLAGELEGTVAVTTDVTRDEDRRRLVETALHAFGRIDVLVNNAGQGLHVPLLEVDLDAFRDVLELNLVAPLALMQLVVPHMREQGGGVIVNVSSGTTRMTIPGVGAYSSTKSALNQLSQTARSELAEHGIAVSLVVPTVTDTEFHESLRQGAWRGGRMRFPAMPASEVAQAILRLVETGDEEALLVSSR
jgi:short-subunit dehydrogenase